MRATGIITRAQLRFNNWPNTFAARVKAEYSILSVGSDDCGLVRPKNPDTNGSSWSPLQEVISACRVRVSEG